jgi:hypothetical protein
MKMFVWVDKFNTDSTVAVLAEDHISAYEKASIAIADQRGTGNPKDVERLLRWGQGAFKFNGEMEVLLN